MDGRRRRFVGSCNISLTGNNLLYWLLYQKGFVVLHIGPFRIFRYLTFRTAFASLTALFMGLVIGPAVDTFGGAHGETVRGEERGRCGFCGVEA